MEPHRRWLVRAVAALAAVAVPAACGHPAATAARLPLPPSTTAPSATLAAPATTATGPRPSVPAPLAAPHPSSTAARTVPPTAPTTTAASCPPSLAGQLANTGGGGQLMTVEAPSVAATTATVTLWQRKGTCWSPAGGPWPARVGRNGLSSAHREGDGTTPIGVYAIGSTFYGLAPNPGVHGSYRQLVCGDWWDEDPSSGQYNTFQHLPCGTTPPFGGQSEALWEATVAYQRFAVIQYNTAPVIAGAGSGIFIHDDTGAGTNGCVSLAPGLGRCLVAVAAAGPAAPRRDRHGGHHSPAVTAGPPTPSRRPARSRGRGR